VHSNCDLYGAASEKAVRARNELLRTAIATLAAQPVKKGHRALAMSED